MLSKEMKSQLKKILFDDLGKGDVTSNVTPLKKSTARLIVKEACVLAGVEEALYIFGLRGVKARAKLKDGNKARKGSVVLELSGGNRNIFNAERTALNVLSRMSAVATICNKAQSIAGKKTRVAITRKTLPGFNLFDNKAADISGVWTHRINLNSFVLLKDNHLPFFNSPAQAAAKARKKYGKQMTIDVEVDSLKQAFSVIKEKPNIVMLDNFSPTKAKKAIKVLRKKGFKGKIELSGGISMRNLKKFADAKPDIISMGWLTHSVAGKDFFLEII